MELGVADPAPSLLPHLLAEIHGDSAHEEPAPGVCPPVEVWEPIRPAFDHWLLGLLTDVLAERP